MSNTPETTRLLRPFFPIYRDSGAGGKPDSVNAVRKTIPERVVHSAIIRCILTGPGGGEGRLISGPILLYRDFGMTAIPHYQHFVWRYYVSFIPLRCLFATRMLFPLETYFQNAACVACRAVLSLFVWRSVDEARRGGLYPLVELHPTIEQE